MACSTVLAVSACGPTRDTEIDPLEDGGLSGMGTSAEDGDAGSGSADGEGGDGGDDGAAGDATGGGESGVNLDIPDDGGGAGDDGTTQEGCDKVDFLFVVDNSSSMIPSQEALIASFPGFMDAITQHEGLQDFHIMIVDSDEGPDQCEQWCSVGVYLGDEKCGGHECGAIWQQDQCAQALGGGIIHPVGGGTNNQPCGIDPAKRYIDANQPDLYDTFACAAQVGNWGAPDERPMASMVAALGAQAQAGACNDGFRRDDAILVVTVITNAVEQTSMEAASPDLGGWHQAVLDAVNGDPDAVVVIGITPGGVPGWDPAFESFVEQFGDQGFWGPIDTDASGFADTFADAVATIEQTCDGFIPPG